MTAASLRRFDLKAKFDFLKPEQAVELAGRVLATTNIALDDAARDRIGHMAQLTPGDFAAVMRQSRFHPLADAVDFAGRLAQGSAFEGSLRTLGPPCGGFLLKTCPAAGSFCDFYDRRRKRSPL